MLLSAHEARDGCGLTQLEPVEQPAQRGRQRIRTLPCRPQLMHTHPGTHPHHPNQPSMKTRPLTSSTAGLASGSASSALPPRCCRSDAMEALSSARICSPVLSCPAMTCVGRVSVAGCRGGMGTCRGGVGTCRGGRVCGRAEEVQQRRRSWMLIAGMLLASTVARTAAMLSPAPCPGCRPQS